MMRRRREPGTSSATDTAKKARFVALGLRAAIQKRHGYRRSALPRSAALPVPSISSDFVPAPGHLADHDIVQAGIALAVSLLPVNSWTYSGRSLNSAPGPPRLPYVCSSCGSGRWARLPLRHRGEGINTVSKRQLNASVFMQNETDRLRTDLCRQVPRLLNLPRVPRTRRPAAIYLV